MDKRLESYIKNRLLKMFPEAQVISEESADECEASDDGGLKFE